LSYSSPTYSVKNGAGSLSVAVNRVGGSSGPASVEYFTQDGSASHVTNFGHVVGNLYWASGDALPKYFSVPIHAATLSQSSVDFLVKISNATGASKASKDWSLVTITNAAAAADVVALAKPTFTVSQSAGALAVSAVRTGSSAGAVSVAYATANGTAVAGKDYTAAAGTLSWAAGDTSAKTFTVAVNKAAPFTGTRDFKVNLSKNTGGATLGTPASATTVINGSAVVASGSCAPNSSSWLVPATGMHIFDWKQYGNYVVNMGNWGGMPNQQLWANDQACWGVTADAITTDYGAVHSYPAVARGWEDNGSILTLSTPGTFDWTTQAGMGIPVTQLTKAKMHWAFQAPATSACTPYCRWDALEDIYFHKSATPNPSNWPPFTDLQIIQALSDAVINNTTFYAMVAANDHATTVTLGGNQYMVFIDDAGGASFHQPGGHTIALFHLPTAFTSNNNNPVWGVTDAVTDIAAVIKYFMQSNPKDDAGKPLLTATGAVVTSPLITPDLYLVAINAGWEIDIGQKFTNTAMCIAMQNEPDCP
jgi:hypothetical protein